MGDLFCKYNFRANFGVLSLGFDAKALVPQGLTGSPNYFGLLNNFMTLIICESLREISETACVTTTWSSRGRTLNTRENQSYVGPIPPSNTYDPDSTNHDKRQEFLSWYQDQVRWRILHFWRQIIESRLQKISRRIFSRGAVWSNGGMYHDCKCL